MGKWIIKWMRKQARNTFFFSFFLLVVKCPIALQHGALGKKPKATTIKIKDRWKGRPTPGNSTYY